MSGQRSDGDAEAGSAATAEDKNEDREEKNQNSSDEQDDKQKRLPPLQWIVERFNFSWFTATQSTGGIAILLSECPKRFTGLQTIGVIVFIFNLALWLLFVALLITRWTRRPSAIISSMTAPPECFFLGSFWLSIATFIACMQRYGVPAAGPWLVVAVRVLFWIYAAITFLSTTIQAAEIMKRRPSRAIDMNPAWFLTVFQAMLTGTVASAIAPSQPPHQRMPIIVAGVAFQGYGWLGSSLILAWFYGRLMENGWPPASAAPGLFLTVGSVGYTIVALIGNARALPADYGYTAAHPTAIEVLTMVATWAGVFLWLFGLWLFALALYVVLRGAVARQDGRWTLPMAFNNTWWAFIFPNIGFVLATIYLGQELASDAIQWVSAIATAAVVAVWLLDLVLMAKTIALSLCVDSSRYRLL